MLLTNPLACPETVQQTGQKHLRGRDQQPATGCDIEQQLSASGHGCRSVVISPGEESFTWGSPPGEDKSFNWKSPDREKASLETHSVSKGVSLLRPQPFPCIGHHSSPDSSLVLFYLNDSSGRTISTNSLP